MLFFGTLRLLMSFLDSSWCLFGRSWAQSGPLNDPQISPKINKNWFNTLPIFFTICEPFLGSKNQVPELPGNHCRTHRLKNVKLSSKSVFGPQQLPKSSQNTNIKRLQNVKPSSKSALCPQELPTVSQTISMKQLNLLKMSLNSASIT